MDDIAQPETNSFAVVILGNLSPNDGWVGPSGAVLVFEKLHILCSGLLFMILRIDAEFSLTDVAAAQENIVNILLRNSKSGSPISLRFCNRISLFFFCGQGARSYAKISSRVTISSAWALIAFIRPTQAI